MGDYLVAIEIKVNPALGFTTSFAVQDIAIESARVFQVGDWKGEMKAWTGLILHGIGSVIGRINILALVLRNYRSSERMTDFLIGLIGRARF